MRFIVFIYQKNCGPFFPVEIRRFSSYHEAAEFAGEYNEDKNGALAAYVENI